MPRSRPASNPISFHKATGQYYVTRGGKRVYLGANRKAAMEKYHRRSLGLDVPPKAPAASATVSCKELANRFLAAQQANWRNREQTLCCYRNWLLRFLRDHPRMNAEDLTVERFAEWKLSLIRRGFSRESINHYLNAVRAMFTFAEDAGIISGAPRLRRVKNESKSSRAPRVREIYTPAEVGRLLSHADHQMRLMVLLGLNCGFGPKDLRDLRWDDFFEGRVTLPRSKTGVCQTFRLWPDSMDAVSALLKHRDALIRRLARRGSHRSDGGQVFVTRFCGLGARTRLASSFGDSARHRAFLAVGFIDSGIAHQPRFRSLQTRMYSDAS